MPKFGSHSLRSAWGAGLLRHIAYPWLQRRRYPGAWERFRQWKTIEFAAPAALEALQRQALQAQLEFIFRAVPFYREWAAAHRPNLESFREPADLVQLPILTKATLREERLRLVVPATPAADLLPNCSGGSTGETVHCYQDRRYWTEARAAQWFLESWWGLRPGERTALIWGNDRDLAQRSLKMRIVEGIEQVRGLNAFALDEAGIAAFLRDLASWQPRYLAGYASALALVADYLLAHPGHRFRLIAIKSTAEVLRPEERRRIELAFQAPVFDFYGSREVNNLAAECPAHAGLHVNSLTRCLEVVNEHGLPLPPGVAGRVLVTDLSNRAMPLIRYENGDIAAWQAGVCPCGRAFPRLQRILGRKSDFIVTQSGKLVHGEYFTHLFYGRPEVRAFQLVQTRKDRVELELVLPDGGLEPLQGELRPKLAAVLGPETAIEFRAVAQIQRSPSGKHRFTVSTVNTPWNESVPPEALCS